MHTFAKRLVSRRPQRGMAGFMLWGPAVLGFAVLTRIWHEPTEQLSREHPNPRTASHALGRFSVLEQHTATDESLPQEALDAYAKLPLSFIANAGQLDQRVHYYSQGPGYAFYLTTEEMVLTFIERSALEGSPSGTAARRDVVPLRAEQASSDAPVRRGVSLGLRFVAANPAAVLRGERQLPGTVNYFIGSDPSEWRPGLATYEQVVYDELWPGIDLALRGEAGQLKYEFLLSPGADVKDIRLAYRGGQRLSLDGQGTLLIDTPVGQLRDSRPVSYQLIAGRRVPLESRYVLTGGIQESSYGFAVGDAYHPAHPLIIDPGLGYSTFLGGGSSDGGSHIAVDSEGQAYIVGGTTSIDFPTTLGAFDRTSNGVGDAFVTKLNAAGSALVYSTFIGGEFDDSGLGIAVDAAGSAYITGFTISADFPTTPGAFDRTASGQFDSFMTKLNATGSALVYSTFVGGELSDRGLGIALDATGKAYVTGETTSDDFPTTAGAFDRTPNGREDVFMTILNSTGSALAYSTFLGGEGFDEGGALAVDAAGNAYVTGFTFSADFPTTPGAFDTTLGGFVDAFITKLDPFRSLLVFSTFLGGEDHDNGESLAVDAAGNAYVTGFTESADFPTTPGAFDRTLGFDDAFISKLDSKGSALVYSTFLGGEEGSDEGRALAVDAAGNAYVTGFTASADFPTTPGAFDRTENGDLDAFMTKLSSAGSALVYSTFLGGEGVDDGRSIAVDVAGDAYVTGGTDSPDFPTTPGAFDRTPGGGSDAFITKLQLAAALCDGRPANLVGTDANDVLIGTDAADVIAGLGGNDGIRGLGGDDFICGGLGADVIEGGGGRDVLFGQAGSDVLDGGPSADQLIGDKGNDTLLGQSGPDELYGGTGDDELNGGSESDFCVGASHVSGDSAINCEAVQGVP